LTPCLPGIL